MFLEQPLRIINNIAGTLGITVSIMNPPLPPFYRQSSGAGVNHRFVVPIQQEEKDSEEDVPPLSDSSLPKLSDLDTSALRG